MTTPRDRLARLLFIVPYVASRGGVPMSELAQKLEVTVKQIAADLELLCMIGRPPLTPDNLVDIYVEDDVVYVELDQRLSRPPSFTHEEASALVLGAKLLDTHGEAKERVTRVCQKILAKLDPATRALVQNAAARITIDASDATAPREILQEAMSQSRTVSFAYYSASSDHAKSYTVEPLAELTHSGFFYLVALDVGAEHKEKLFRLDRMAEVHLGETRFVPPDRLDLEKYRTSTLAPREGALTAKVRFTAAVAPRAIEQFPKADREERGDGSVVVRVTTSSPAYLARWVLPYGLDAEVMRPNEARAALASLCAEAAAAYDEDL